MVSYVKTCNFFLSQGVAWCSFDQGHVKFCALLLITALCITGRTSPVVLAKTKLYLKLVFKYQQIQTQFEKVNEY